MKTLVEVGEKKKKQMTKKAEKNGSSRQKYDIFGIFGEKHCDYSLFTIANESETTVFVFPI